MRDPGIRSVLVIGSGPIVIGQAAEFDYSGTQAVEALNEEGIRTLLVNSNPATIMTDPALSERVYLEPLTLDSVRRILERERPDGIVATVGGQMGLNLAVALSDAGVLDALGVRILGTGVAAIRRAEDREAFRALMLELREPIPRSVIVTDVQAGMTFADQVGLPLVVRPAYTLGGSGGGVARDAAALERVLSLGLEESPVHQVLLEESIAGQIEVEFEVVRDGAGQIVAVCHMENLDPVGIHTGDSIVCAPCQTLPDPVIQRLRSAAFRIVGALGVKGACNIQFGVDLNAGSYRVIEVNPRVSRSSALASKATGYPIARVAAKIAVGLRLDEIPNPITQTTTALFEPALDYVVVKVPRWPFDKFSAADRQLGTQMKSTGEVMAIERTFRAAIQKAFRSLDTDGDLVDSALEAVEEPVLWERARSADDRRLSVVMELLRRGAPLERIHRETNISRFFLAELLRIVESEAAVARAGADLDPELLRWAKREGLSDERIALATGQTEAQVRALRQRWGIRPVYKLVDTCAGEFAAVTPYYYGTYEQEDEVGPLDPPVVVVLGSGPIRIGQGIEFDACAVEAIGALRRRGVRAVMINSNPETVSTDWSRSDRLYFEPLRAEEVLEILDRERPAGVMVGVGGQTALNLARAVEAAGYPVLGTSAQVIDQAEDRGRFDALLQSIGIDRPRGVAAMTPAEAMERAGAVGYPLLVRPSYVLGGRAMRIVQDPTELLDALSAGSLGSGAILLDAYVEGAELEVDAVADGERVVVAGILQHIERAGVHSGDSIAVYPPRRLGPRIRARIVEMTRAISLGLGVRGHINIQYVLKDDRLQVIEANPRASRTIPFLEKVSGCPIVDLATQVGLGRGLAELGAPDGLWPEPPFVAVKCPVFSWSKLSIDARVGPEMQSTGEVIGIDPIYPRALKKALVAASLAPKPRAGVLVMASERQMGEAVGVARELEILGFGLYATDATHRALRAQGIRSERVPDVGEASPDAIDLVRGGRVGLIIDTRPPGEHEGRLLRRAATERRVPCLTSIDTARAMAEALDEVMEGPCLSLQEYQAGRTR